MEIVGIVEKYQDMAMKWRVRVSFDDNSSTFLKFQTDPTDEEVFAEANKYISLLVLEKSEIESISAKVDELSIS